VVNVDSKWWQWHLNGIRLSSPCSVYKPKHVARNTTNTSNILTVVYEYII